MTYGSRSDSASPSQDHGGKQYDLPTPAYEDMDFGDQDEKEHMTPLPSTIVSGGLPINRRS